VRLKVRTSSQQGRRRAGGKVGCDGGPRRFPAFASLVVCVRSNRRSNTTRHAGTQRVILPHISLGREFTRVRLVFSSRGQHGASQPGREEYLLTRLVLVLGAQNAQISCLWSVDNRVAPVTTCEWEGLPTVRDRRSRRLFLDHNRHPSCRESFLVRCWKFIIT
jgi:hypothetical protein